MPPLFQWGPEHSVSVQRFDSEHQRLFGYINELSEAMSTGQGRLVVKSTLEKLSEYCRLHFAGEESAMRYIGYAQLEEHIAEHRKLTETVARHYDEYCADTRYYMPVDLLYFLRDWLVQHIMDTDRKYSEAMKRGGIV